MADATWQARGVVKGQAQGMALVSDTALSFLGDLDIRSGQVVGRSSDLLGACVAGRVLVLPASRGSAGAWRFLYQLKVHDTHPAALILRDLPDPSVTQGAILADVPIVVEPEAAFWTDLRNGDMLHVDGDSGCITRC
ncbi:aconitase X swivel domain-containing protein [Chachezhania antarctica]|uniref:aconitase X swivel domain-containing protein n=1 Tax=Chachezhania antarctica TaxID=2340860 RepID=UPI000EADEF9F|nr:DUF126 domain-containing protein [Chachezhania antarctica]|tara:strand:- start:10926 stop:11336 length:411 start_codon:yes stop_codon:yes gene_type:complete